MELILTGLREAIERILRLDPDVLQAAEATLVVSGSAMALSLLVGLPLGALIGLARFPGRNLALAVVNTGIGLPPVVVGLFVASLVWRSGPLGGLDLYCTRPAIVMAQFLLAVPVVTGLSAVALQNTDPMLRLQLYSLGATRLQSAWILLRETRLLLLSAGLVGFGAIVSEIGAALMVGCNVRGDTRLLTTAIALQTGQGEFGIAYALGFILLALVFAISAITTSIQQRQRPR